MNRLFLASSYVLSVFILLSMVLFSCNSSKKWTRAMEPDLYQQWIHVFEEDNPSAKMYRPQGYEISPARGRESFEIQKGGALIFKGFGPTDAPISFTGQWKISGKNQIDFQFDTNPELNRTLEIIALTQTYLVVKPQ